MIDFFHKTYSLFCNENKLLNRLKINGGCKHIIRIAANACLPIWFYIDRNHDNYSINNCTKKEGRIIASLTTFPARIDKVWIVVESILRQSIKPDLLFLWLSKEQFPSKEVLPRKLLEQEKRGLQIILCTGDLRSHKKYYYVLRDFPKDHLFTFDDDIIYPSNVISTVLAEAKLHPQSIIGRYSNHLKKTSDNIVCFDGHFKEPFVGIPSWSTFIGSGGGTLFPAGFLPSITLDKDFFMINCRTADDVWLNSMCRYSRHKVVAIMNHCPLLEVINNNNSALTEINYGAENQKQINAVREYCVINGVDPYEFL